MTRLTPLGQQRLLEIVGRITQRPECWRQRQPWLARGRGCVFAHLTGYPRGSDKSVFCDGAEMLQLPRMSAAWLYDASRTLAELQRAATDGEVPV